MLEAIAAKFGGQIVDSLLGKITGVFQAYFNKQITEAQLREQLLQAVVATFGEIEKAYADALAKTYASFMQTLAASRLMQAVWSTVVLTQLAVLTWHQVGIPAVCYFEGKARCYPSSGATVEWAYLLIAACLGMAPVAMRAGPGAGSLLGRLKGFVGK